MRNLIIYLAVFLCSIASGLYAQESFEARAKAIASNIEKITKEEKEALKKQVEEVNVELDKNNITKEQADEKKMQFATTSANNIENRISFEEAKLSKLVMEKVEGKLVSNSTKEVDRRKSIKIYYGDDATSICQEVFPNKKTSPAMLSMPNSSSTDPTTVCSGWAMTRITSVSGIAPPFKSFTSCLTNARLCL